jgi:periplasmic divalent cation tolerance protein
MPETFVYSTVLPYLAVVGLPTGNGELRSFISTHMEPATGEILVLTTVATAEQAQTLSEGLLNGNIAACVTVLPGALSNYRWQGKTFFSEPEQVLLIKTHREKLSDLEKHFTQHHPYECPELLVFEVAGISKAYADWMREQLGLSRRRANSSQH